MLNHNPGTIGAMKEYENLTEVRYSRKGKVVSKSLSIQKSIFDHPYYGPRIKRA